MAAYCRVSTLLDNQETSIESQHIHYSSLIRSHSEWDLAGIYLEAGVSGTKAENWPELQRLLEDCRQGKIDLIHNHPAGTLEILCNRASGMGFCWRLWEYTHMSGRKRAEII